MARAAPHKGKGKGVDQDFSLAEALAKLEFQIKGPGLGRDELTPREVTNFKRTLAWINRLVQGGSVVPTAKPHGRIVLVPKKFADLASREQENELESIVAPRRCLLTKDSVILTSHSNRVFAAKIARMLGVKATNNAVAKTRKFSDGELMIEIDRSVKLNGSKVYLFPNTREPIEKNTLELLLTIQAVKEAGAATVTVVMPYMPFGRSDRPEKHSHTSVGAEAFAAMLKNAGVNFIITMDPHSMKPIDPYFKRDSELLVLYAYNLAYPELSAGLKRAKVDFANLRLMSPDRGGLLRIMYYSEQFDLEAGWLKKHRDQPNQIGQITGPYLAQLEANGDRKRASRKPMDVKNRDVLLIDDMDDTFGTKEKTCTHLRDLGANRIFSFSTHAVLSGAGFRRLMRALDSGLIEHAYYTNTVPWKRGYPRTRGVTILEVEAYFAEAIRRHSHGLTFEPLHSPNWRQEAKVPAAHI